LELEIEKLVYGGDGLARLPANEHGPGKAAFLPFVLEGERVEAAMVEEKRGFARAALDRVVKSSAHRVQAPCPYFMRCGGCHYQHSDYEHQLAIKASILKENLRRTAKLDVTELQVHASPPWNYRNRTRLRVQTTPLFALGYNRFRSHQLEPVKECPISSPLINRAIQAMWRLGEDKRVSDAVREVELFASADDSQLLIEVYADMGSRNASQAQVLAQELVANVPDAAGVAVFSAPQPHTSLTSEGALLAKAGASALDYKSGATNYRVSAGSFFQTNRHLTSELVEIVTAGRSGHSALDLYAGVGLFSTVLAQAFERVVGVESSPQSFADLKYNSPGNVKAIGSAVEAYLTRAVEKGKTDLIVVDPPRGGLGSKVADSLLRFEASRLSYVSCDPATLARDLVPLLAAGYRVEQAHLVDLFPQTFHIESVLHLVRSS
jgi:23S rRNA (uracil1939-C5)-methyltransferase